MSYTYKGAVYSIKSPIKSISVNKSNIAITDQDGTKRIMFNTVNESKSFLTWLYQA